MCTSTVYHIVPQLCLRAGHILSFERLLLSRQCGADITRKRHRASASSSVGEGGGLRLFGVLRDNCIETDFSSVRAGFITAIEWAELVMYWRYEGSKEPRATTPICYERRHQPRARLKSDNLSRHTCIRKDKSRLLCFYMRF